MRSVGDGGAASQERKNAHGSNLHLCTRALEPLVRILSLTLASRAFPCPHAGALYVCILLRLQALQDPQCTMHTTVFSSVMQCLGDRRSLPLFIRSHAGLLGSHRFHLIIHFTAITILCWGISRVTIFQEYMLSQKMIRRCSITCHRYTDLNSETGVYWWVVPPHMQ